MGRIERRTCAALSCKANPPNRQSAALGQSSSAAAVRHRAPQWLSPPRQSPSGFARRRYRQSPNRQSAALGQSSPATAVRPRVPPLQAIPQPAERRGRGNPPRQPPSGIERRTCAAPPFQAIPPTGRAPRWAVLIGQSPSGLARRRYRQFPNRQSARTGGSPPRQPPSGLAHRPVRVPLQAIPQPAERRGRGNPPRQVPSGIERPQRDNPPRQLPSGLARRLYGRMAGKARRSPLGRWFFSVPPAALPQPSGRFLCVTSVQPRPGASNVSPAM